MPTTSGGAGGPAGTINRVERSVRGSLPPPSNHEPGAECEHREGLAASAARRPAERATAATEGVKEVATAADASRNRAEDARGPRRSRRILHFVDLDESRVADAGAGSARVAADGGAAGRVRVDGSDE